MPDIKNVYVESGSDGHMSVAPTEEAHKEADMTSDNAF